MSMTGLDVFDSTVHQTNVWLKSIMDRLGTDDRHRAYLALRATLHALRDRLPPEVAVHLGAQLPMLVRGFYYEEWHIAGTPTRERHAAEFPEPIRPRSGAIPKRMSRRWRRRCSPRCGRHRFGRGQEGDRRPAARAAHAMAGGGGPGRGDVSALGRRCWRRA